MALAVVYDGGSRSDGAKAGRVEETFRDWVLRFGILTYLRLGRDEHPAFSIKTMVVIARWPGATIDDTLD